jgi:hypothetical protein
MSNSIFYINLHRNFLEEITLVSLYISASLFYKEKLICSVTVSLCT